METLVVIDGENSFSKDLRYKISTLSGIHPIVVLGSQQIVRGADCQDVGVVKVDIRAKNAVDFVVVSVLATKMSSGKYDKGLIVSDDVGYDSSIYYLRDIGYDVNRVSHSEFVGYVSKSEEDTFNNMLKSSCGFIKNSINIGEDIEVLKEKLGKVVGLHVDVIVDYLNSNNTIDIIEDKVYYDKELLAEIAKGYKKIS